MCGRQLAEGQATSNRLVNVAFVTLRAVCVSGPRGRELEEETKRGRNGRNRK